jgi:hypothetical protein
MTDHPTVGERDKRAIRIWNGCIRDKAYTPGHIADEIRDAEKAAREPLNARMATTIIKLEQEVERLNTSLAYYLDAVRQADCLVCFQREMEPMERGTVRRTRIEDAKWTCAYCKALGDPEYRKGDYQIHQWWHATARGDKWCNAQAIWNRIAEEGE